MSVLRRNVVDNDIEKKILTGIIINDDFCRMVQPMLRRDFFKIDYAKIIVGWVQDYWRRYKVTPKKQIQDIYTVEKEKMKQTDADLIGEFLSDLSARYEENSAFNAEYLADQARLYFRERALQILSDNIDGLVLRGRIDEAEGLIINFNKVAADTRRWFNPFSPENICRVFNDDASNRLFSLPGLLGRISGPLERDWLVAFMGPMKRGKSWYLQEFAIQALFAGLRVAYFSFEMNGRECSKRMFRRISFLANRAGRYKVPVFDCERNQDGTCDKLCRSCKISIKDAGQETPDFEDVEGYIPCTYCKNKENEKEDYVRSAWFQWCEQQSDFDQKIVSGRIKNFQRLFGDNCRVISYPAFTAGFDDIEKDLEDMEYQDGFIPDIICIDYFDILNPGPGSHGLSERGVADLIWKTGKGMASKRHCLVATVLQSNRASIKKSKVEQTDTSEDIRKLAHPDLMFSLNQKPDEKAKGIMRIGVVVHRHEDFDFAGEVLVLQSYALGQPLLDEDWVKNIYDS